MKRPINKLDKHYLSRFDFWVSNLGINREIDFRYNSAEDLQKDIDEEDMEDLAKRIDEIKKQICLLQHIKLKFYEPETVEKFELLKIDWLFKDIEPKFYEELYYIKDKLSKLKGKENE